MAAQDKHDISKVLDKQAGQTEQNEQAEQNEQTEQIEQGAQLTRISPLTQSELAEPACQNKSAYQNEPACRPEHLATLDLLDTRKLPKPAFFQSIKDAFLGKACILDCIQVEVTSICGGCCVYCPHTTARDSWRSRHMKDATFMRLWPLMLRSRRVHLQGWGEPFLHPRFMEYVQVARKAGCQVSSTTCGLHMDDSLAKAIVGSGIDLVAFSLAGTDAKSNASRAGVPFDHVIDAIERLQYWRKRLQGVHLEIHLAYLVLAPAMEALRTLPELMQKLGIHATVLSTLDYLALPEHASLAFAVHEREKIAKAQALIHEIRPRIEAQGADLYASLPDEQPAYRCRENSARTTYIDAEGLMSPCIYLNVPNHFDAKRHRIIGNVTTDDPLELWHSPEYTAFRDAVSTEAPDALCLPCPKRHEAPC